ncbi:MAG: tetratricopeptide repeat protein [Candidatus Omnitrophica bacterium]|nr:tetratricopeptide repeat protein [Candidatus Omnitrophota bacterium]
MDKTRLLIYIFAIVALGGISYANVLGGEFIWDDIHLVSENSYIKHLSGVGDIFTKPVRGGGAKTFGFYRPLQILSYMLEYRLWGLSPQGYHIVNIALHILVALSIFWLLNILFKDYLLSFLAGALFVVHPVHTEAVSYISGRADPLAAFFLVLTLVFYIKHIQEKKYYYFAALLCYLLALLSRESALILPALVLLYHFSFRKKLERKEIIPLLAISLVYIFLRLTYLKFPFVHSGFDANLWQRIPGFFVALSKYLRILILPLGLHMEYGNLTFALMNPQVLWGLALFLALIALLLKESKDRGIVFFSIGWFFITLFPSANFYPLNAYMAEHWLYLPAVGFFLILAKGLEFLFKKRGMRILALLLSITILGFYSVSTIRQNRYWQSAVSFYETTLRFYVKNPRMYNNLALEYQLQGKNNEAVSLYKKAIAIRPTYAMAYNNMGSAYLDMGEEEKALGAYEKAIELKPDYAKAYNNAGNIYSKMGRKDRAIATYEKAKDLDPNFVEVHVNLGNMYYERGDYEKSVAAFKKAIEINPDFAQAYSNLAVVYYYQKKYTLAVEYADKAEAMGCVNETLSRALKVYR